MTRDTQSSHFCHIHQVSSCPFALLWERREREMSPSVVVVAGDGGRRSIDRSIDGGVTCDGISEKSRSICQFYCPTCCVCRSVGKISWEQLNSEFRIVGVASANRSGNCVYYAAGDGGQCMQPQCEKGGPNEPIASVHSYTRSSTASLFRQPQLLQNA